MVEVFAEVRRVLRRDGTCWVNIGDSFSSGGRSSQVVDSKAAAEQAAAVRPASIPGIKPKDLVGIPWMLAFALRADGWYLRRDVIWNKPNPMPESVTDRPTSSHEYLFLLTQSPRYFYDAEAIREQGVWAGQGRSDRGPRESHAPGTPPHRGLRNDKQRGHDRRHDGFNDRWDSMSKDEQQALGRNKRSVWTIATRPYPEAHFATFPPDLVEPCILAGTPPKACGECGAFWARQVERASYGSYHDHEDDLGVGHRTTRGMSGREFAASYVPPRTLGWRPTCSHDDDSGRAVVLDPFAGAGTTLLVSTQLGRDSIGIELNPTYAEMAEDRIRRWEANPAGHLKSKPLELVGQGSLLDPAPEGEVA